MSEYKVEEVVTKDLEIKISYLCPYCKTQQEKRIRIEEGPHRYVWVLDDHNNKCRVRKELSLSNYVEGKQDCCWNCSNGFITSHEDHDWVRCKLVVKETYGPRISRELYTFAAVSPDGYCDKHERSKVVYDDAELDE